MPKFSSPKAQAIYEKYHNAPFYNHLIKNGHSDKDAVKGFSELEKLISEQRAQHYGFQNTEFYQNLLENGASGEEIEHMYKTLQKLSTEFRIQFLQRSITEEETNFERLSKKLSPSLASTTTEDRSDSDSENPERRITKLESSTTKMKERRKIQNPPAKSLGSV